MAKQILLIGDSIRMGYCETVKAELADKAAEVSADGDGQWSWSFPGLPRNAGGKEINYSIHEDPVPDYRCHSDRDLPA